MFKKLLLAVLIALVPFSAIAGRNGSGTYTAPSNSWNPAVSGQTLSSSDWNTTLTDIETALSNSIAVDGQTTITGNIPFNSNKITGLAAGTAAGDAAPLTQIQGAAYGWITTPGGTGDVITGNLSPTPTAYTTGMRVAFVASAANTTATTINLNSLGAKSITKKGSTALAANDILSGQVVFIVYDGTRFQIQSPIFSSVAAITSGSVTGLTTLNVSDSVLRVQDNGDATKQIAFEASGITTGTTRTITVPDADLTLVGLTNTQTLTNKTLTSPIMTAPTLGVASATSITFGGTALSTFVESTYTPTLTNTTNVAASTAAVTRYTRVGNTVTVYGRVSIDPTATGTNLVMGMSLPVASNFANAYDAGGASASANGTGVGANNNFAISADATNDRFTFSGDVANGANLDFNFTATYVVQ